jgi:hypothetical protein
VRIFRLRSASLGPLLMLRYNSLPVASGLDPAKMRRVRHRHKRRYRRMFDLDAIPAKEISR